jgi:hypothetical protein
MGRQGVVYSRGTCQDLKVNASAVPDVNITVKLGACYVRGTQATDQGMYHVFNDADLVIPLLTNNPANGANPRIDLVVARMQDQQYSGAVDVPTIEMVTGVPAGVPAVPAAPANSLILAQIAVGAAVATITQGNITDRRVPAGNSPIVLDDILVGTDARYPAAVTPVDFLNASGVGTNLIPPGLGALEVEYVAREGGAVVTDNMGMRFNADAAANYYRERIGANGAAVAATELLGQTSGEAGSFTGGTVADAAQFGHGRVWIPNPSGIQKKGWRAQSGLSTGLTTGLQQDFDLWGLWNNAAPITRITMLAPNGTFNVGSRFRLIGHVGIQP